MSKIQKWQQIYEKYFLLNDNYSKAVITESEIATINAINAFWSDSGGSFFPTASLANYCDEGWNHVKSRSETLNDQKILSWSSAHYWEKGQLYDELKNGCILFASFSTRSWTKAD